MIQPIRPFLLLLITGAILALLMTFMPEQVSIAAWEIRFPTWHNTVLKEKPQYADIKAITKRLEETEAAEAQAADSLKPTAQDSMAQQTPPPPQAGRFEYAPGQDTLLYPFFRTLDALKDGQLRQSIHIVHFGDSQLEGDRITAELRHRLQSRFGGCGPGLQGISNHLNAKISVYQTNDKRWQWYPLFGKRSQQAPSRYFGLLGNMYAFAPSSPAPLDAEKDMSDSLASPALPDTTSGIARQAAKLSKQNMHFQIGTVYHRSKQAHAKDREVQRVKVLFRSPESSLRVKVLHNGQVACQESFQAAPSLQMLVCDIDSEFQNISIQFEGSGALEVYGSSLECRSGVVVDNVPMRGSSGLEFTKIPPAHLRAQLRALNVRLLIFQFGVNVGEAEDYGFYEELFYKQLKYFREVAPDVPILVISTSDRSKKEGTHYVSLKNIDKLRDAQRRAAFRAGCAFWDLFQAMGGLHSMPAWVEEKLANKDYTHFSLRGARLVSEMLYEALMYEYELYKMAQKPRP
ncbi:MAG: hypothetical protein KatS3mg033_1386 [Thermonema sp.]|nr:MAG: hypothetical protein KatS3mg033_1386 [Thermonema sp.]